jgi:UPF0755 protein
MTVKELNTEKSVNDSKKKDVLENSSSKKKGIPNSGTDVFLQKPLDDNNVSPTKSTSRDNYWQQGNLFDLGESIKNLNNDSKIDLDKVKVKVKKSLKKDTLDKSKLDKSKIDDTGNEVYNISKEEKLSKNTDSNTISNKKASKNAPKTILTSKKPSSTSKKGSINTKKGTSKPIMATSKTTKATAKPAKPAKPAKAAKATVKPAKATVKPTKATAKPAKATVKPAKATVKPKKTTVKPKKTTVKPKKTTSKATIKNTKVNSAKKAVVKKTPYINKESINSKIIIKGLKTTNSSNVRKKVDENLFDCKNTRSQNISNYSNNKKCHSKKSHFISNVLIVISILLIFVIGFLFNSYLKNERNDELLISTKDTERSLIKSESEVFETAYKLGLGVPTIIKPTIKVIDETISYEIIIDKGMSAKDVAHLIALSGYQNEDLVLQYFIDNDISKKINVGTYYLIPSMSLSEIADKITIKDNFSMLIYPGMTLAQIDSILSKRNLCEDGAFIDECTSICDEYGLSFVEGWFYPGKYDINRVLDVRELCLNMYYATLNALSPLLDDIANSNYSIEQTLIIASLIQAETNNISQMPLISEVIHNRLKSDMPLGINATTCYELGVYKSDIDQSVYDTITDYNTRRKKGLVPSAISTVSFEALEAAVHPSIGDYFYYNHTEDGDMLMAKTYKKHLKNIEGNK